jgi:hypothetical protein
MARSSTGGGVSGVVIRLTNGWTALVSARDAPRVNTYSWHLKTGGAPDKVYAQTTVRTGDGGKRSVLLHRFIMGARPGEIVDHKSGDTLDCRRSNLRVTTTRGNAANITHSKNQKRGGWKGVSWNKNAGKWEASIAGGHLKPSGRRAKVHLGLYDDPKRAARAYDAAARKCFGRFASLNFP